MTYLTARNVLKRATPNNMKEIRKMARKTPSLKTLAVHILGLGALAAIPAHATLIVNNLSVNGRANANTVTNLFGPASDPTYISGSNSANDTDGSDSSANAWGNQYGTYYAGASGNGVFNSFGQFHRTVELTNDNGYDTDYSLNFFIYYGGMSAYSNGATGNGWGSYDLSIMNGKNTLFSSGAKIHSNGTLETSGTQLNGATQNGSSYYWNGTYVTLDLGTLANGESLSIDFDLISTAFGDFAFSDCGGGGGYGGYGGYGGDGDGDVEITSFAAGGYGGCTGSVNASLGDPGGFNEAEIGKDDPTVVITGTRTPNQVPLPGTLALLGVGWAGLGFARKKLKR